MTIVSLSQYEDDQLLKRKTRVLLSHRLHGIDTFVHNPRSV